MSDKKINLRIVTPDKIVFEGPVDAVGAMGSEGAFTALPGHIPFLTDLAPGLLWYRDQNGTRELAVSGGFAEIQAKHANILADSAEYLEEIDLERAEQSLKRAQDRLAKAKVEAKSASEHQTDEISKASFSLNKAATRIKLASNRRTRH